MLCFSGHSFANSIISKEESARIFGLSKNDWASEVVRANSQGLARQIVFAGNLGLRTTVSGVILTVVPFFSDESRPDYISIINFFPSGNPVHRLSDAEIREICEKAYRQTIDEYSFLCASRRVSGGLELTFAVGIKGKYAAADAANSKQIFFVDVNTLFGWINEGGNSLRAKYWSDLDAIVDGSGSNSSFAEVLLKKRLEICGKLALVYRNDVSFKREDFDFDVDVCMKATAHRRVKQPEFSNPSIISRICYGNNDFHSELCKRANISQK